MELYFLVFFGGLGMLLSFAGLGYLLNLLTFPGKNFDFGWRAVFGLSLFIFIGGYLNLFQLISKTSLLAVLSVGLLAALVMIYRTRKTIGIRTVSIFHKLKKDKILLTLVLLVSVLLFFRYAAAVSFFPFHAADDYHGYLVFPAKMIQTGSLGNDPFSERRIVSSLGGGYFLDAAVLSFGEFKNLHLIDNGLGFILLLFLLWSQARGLGLERKRTLALILLLLLISTPSYNMTSFFLSAALFLGLFRIAYDRKDLKDWQANLAASIITVALIIIKTNMVIPAMVLFAGFFIATFYRQKKSVWLTNILLSLGVFLIAILPWMLAMYQSCHTLFYPFLGRGYYGTTYGNFAGSFLEFNFYSVIRLVSEVFIGLCLFLPLLGVAYLVLRSTHLQKRRLLLILAACFLGIAAIIYGVGGYSLYYYTFPFVLPTVLFLLAVLLAGKSDKADKFPVYTMIIAAFMAGFFLQKSLIFLDEVKSQISFDNGLKIGLVNTDLVPAESRKEYHNLQMAVPRGEKILSRLDRNFLFDFKRNEVFIIDLPGGASLPPGLPFQAGSEKLANYLLSSGIKYIAYSYGNEAGFSCEGSKGMLRAHVNPWLKAETEHSLDFQDNLIELSKTRKIIYDDGNNFVLDLSFTK
jgi:hypothetical protein